MKAFHKFLIAVGLAFLSACGGSSDSIPLPKNIQLFEQDLEQHNRIPDGTALLFVLNPSACNPCEQEIARLLNGDYGDVKKRCVVPKEVPLSFSLPVAYKRITYPHRQLSEYGVTNANGTILLFRNRKCILCEPIDVQRIGEQIERIQWMAAENRYRFK
jgi:hypothetical protein